MQEILEKKMVKADNRESREKREGKMISDNEMGGGRHTGVVPWLSCGLGKNQAYQRSLHAISSPALPTREVNPHPHRNESR